MESVFNTISYFLNWIEQNEFHFDCNVWSSPRRRTMERGSGPNSRDGSSIVPNVSNIRMKAQLISREMNIGNFSDGPMWCYWFMKRNNLTVCSHSMVGQKLPDDCEKKSDDFLTFYKKIILKNNFTADLIFNMTKFHYHLIYHLPGLSMFREQAVFLQILQEMKELHLR